MCDLGHPVIEGKSKKFYKYGTNNLYMVFKPHLRSVTSKREGNIIGTDIERMMANNIIFNILENKGIPTHIWNKDLVSIDNNLGMVVERTKTIPIEFICRYYAAGSIVRLYPSIVKKDMKFKQPLYKYDLKQDVSVAGVDDPTLNENYIVGLELLTKAEFNRAHQLLKDIGNILNETLNRINLTLIDMKMEFGFSLGGDIILIDEITQDCIRANNTRTWEPMTKDAYRNMKSDEEVLEKYKEFNRRLETL